MGILKTYRLADFGSGLIDETAELKLVAEKSNINNSYSTEETLTGGTWIDGKPIYTITQLTADPIPVDIDTRFPDEIIGTYTVYKYTKTTP